MSVAQPVRKSPELFGLFAGQTGEHSCSRGPHYSLRADLEVQEMGARVLHDHPDPFIPVGVC